MRSKEVDLAINQLKEDAELIVYGNMLCEEKTICKKENLKTVLSYIEQLEKMIPTPSNEVPVEYQTLILVDKRDAVMKSEIRDKIKELEEDKETILQAIEEAKESKDEEFLKYNREILYRINGEISVLKSIIGE